MPVMFLLVFASSQADVRNVGGGYVMTRDYDVVDRDTHAAGSVFAGGCFGLVCPTMFYGIAMVTLTVAHFATKRD